MKKMPPQDKYNSKQDYGTPKTLITNIEEKYGKLVWDLAASALNAKASNFITEQENSLSVDWNSLDGLQWLNPPFANIEPWAKKCQESESKIIMLTPASVGSNWFAKHCHGKSKVIFVRPRITFEGAKDPYPKDCMLTLWRIEEPGYDIWNYNEQ